MPRMQVAAVDSLINPDMQVMGKVFGTHRVQPPLPLPPLPYPLLAGSVAVPGHIGGEVLANTILQAATLMGLDVSVQNPSRYLCVGLSGGEYAALVVNVHRGTEEYAVEFQRGRRNTPLPFLRFCIGCIQSAIAKRVNVKRLAPFSRSAGDRIVPKPVPFPVETAMWVEHKEKQADEPTLLCKLLSSGTDNDGEAKASVEEGDCGCDTGTTDLDRDCLMRLGIKLGIPGSSCLQTQLAYVKRNMRHDFGVALIYRHLEHLAKTAIHALDDKSTSSDNIGSALVGAQIVRELSERPVFCRKLIRTGIIGALTRYLDTVPVTVWTAWVHRLCQWTFDHLCNQARRQSTENAHRSLHKPLPVEAFYQAISQDT